MTRLLLAFSVTFLGGLTVESGPLSQYDEQATIDTRWYRQEMGQIPLDLPENAVLLAVADCDDIGRSGLISVNGGEWEPFWVYDCAGSNHAYSWLVDNGFLGEMDYYTAERHNVICRCPVPGEMVWIDR